MTSADDQHESTTAGTSPAVGPEGPAGDVAAGEAEAGSATVTDQEGGDTMSGTEAGAGMANDTPTELVADLAKAQEDVATLTGDLQRLQAEYVNYKRRVDRDRELVKQNATFAVLSALLPVLDDIDRAREHGEVEGGFKAVADSLERIVASLGLEKFGKSGDEFDPNLHEALMHSHSPDVTTTTCRDIVHAGYRIGDRVVRPARVTVVDPEPGAPAGGAVDEENDSR
ncbi:MAG TPA: nucleotide exchange factor GrpE [Nocardioidaceae bacterium]|nr:nucleotide exchange factor GrpE [Nocardioidaceae bacterium]